MDTLIGDAEITDGTLNMDSTTALVEEVAADLVVLGRSVLADLGVATGLFVLVKLVDTVGSTGEDEKAVDVVDID